MTSMPVLEDAAVLDPVEFAFKFERRNAARVNTVGWVMACFREPDEQPRLSPLRLADISQSGAGGYSDRPFPPGTTFELFSAGISAPTRSGEVARCVREATGEYRLGLAFAASAIAA